MTSFCVVARLSQVGFKVAVQQQSGKYLERGVRRYGVGERDGVTAARLDHTVLVELEIELAQVCAPHAHAGDAYHLVPLHLLYHRIGSHRGASLCRPG
jgi:hypothetical protein